MTAPAAPNASPQLLTERSGLREALGALPRQGLGLVRAPATLLADGLGWHRETVDAGLRRLEALGEVRIVQRGRGKRGALVSFLRDGKPTRVPVWKAVSAPQ